LATEFEWGESWAKAPVWLKVCGLGPGREAVMALEKEAELAGELELGLEFE
jgi:hypothetical protein